MSKGVLIVIGGHEDKRGERVILKEVARRVRGGKLVIATVASHEPEGYFESYQQGFAGLGMAEERRDRPLSMFDVDVQVLSSGDTFDLLKRQPSKGAYLGA